MRCLLKNKQTLYYALNQGRTQILDSHGNRTGEWEISYSDPVKAKMNISASKGTSDSEAFGVSVNYTKTLSTDDMKCPITETTVLWIDREPTEPYNYVVTKVAKSLNSITYAILEVENG